MNPLYERIYGYIGLVGIILEALPRLPKALMMIWRVPPLVSPPAPPQGRG